MRIIIVKIVAAFIQTSLYFSSSGFKPTLKFLYGFISIWLLQADIEVGIYFFPEFMSRWAC